MTRTPLYTGTGYLVLRSGNDYGPVRHTPSPWLRVELLLWQWLFGHQYSDERFVCRRVFCRPFHLGFRSGDCRGRECRGESPAIAPNTWVEIKGVNLAPSSDSRIWQASDFVGTQMPTELDQ